MKELLEIGIEKELFLLKNGIIQEPNLFGFPWDCMGFLVEIRSLPSDRAYPVITTIFNEELQYRLRANKFGMDLIANSHMNVNKKFVKHIEDTYHIRDFKDLTKNIYRKKGSHHLGVFQIEDSEIYKLTAGIHVHFSSRDSETGKTIELPIEKIVEEMDDSFHTDIERTGRISGEYEIKKDGHFEYRSLPCDVDVIEVVKESFKILRGI